MPSKKIDKNANSVIGNTKEYTFKQLDSKVNSLVKGPKKLRFSMAEWIEDFSDDRLMAPDFDSEEPVFNGKCVFFDYRGYQSRIIENPIWKDILVEANYAATGDHIFLESISFDSAKKDVKYCQWPLP